MRFGQAIKALLAKSIAGDGKVKGFKPHVVASRLSHFS
jgi:hypothetical protein